MVKSYGSEDNNLLDNIISFFRHTKVLKHKLLDNWKTGCQCFYFYTLLEGINSRHKVLSLHSNSLTLTSSSCSFTGFSYIIEQP